MKKSDGTDDIRKQVEDRVEQEKQAYPPGEGKGEITDDFLDKCIDLGQLGDGIVYAKFHRDTFAYNSTTGEWFENTNNKSHLSVDEAEKHLAAVENVSRLYAGRAARLGEQISRVSQGVEAGNLSKLLPRQGEFYKRIKKLHSDRYRAAVPKFARTNDVESLAVSGDQFNKKPMLLPCGNGVANLLTGAREDPKPSDYLTMASPHNLPEDLKTSQLFEDTFLEALKGDQDLMSFMQRSAGYWATGRVDDPYFWCLVGDGRNAKTLFISSISYALGPFARAIPSEMLLDQRYGRSAAGPSPDIMLLKDLRLAIGSESDEGRKWAAGRVKWLSGGDQLVGRAPHDKHLSHFWPSHKLVLLTNNKPQAPAWDFAFWERMLLVPFTLSFVDREPQEPHERRANKKLPDALKKEAPGILAWIVRGCLEWQQRGLDPPKVVTDAVSEYRRDEDLLSDFIEDRCVLEPVVVGGSTEIYHAFEDWYTENVGSKVPTQNWLGKQLRRRFEKVKRDGRNCYRGITVQE